MGPFTSWKHAKNTGGTRNRWKNQQGQRSPARRRSWLLRGIRGPGGTGQKYNDDHSPSTGRRIATMVHSYREPAVANTKQLEWQRTEDNKTIWLQLTPKRTTTTHA